MLKSLPVFPCRHTFCPFLRLPPSQRNSSGLLSIASLSVQIPMFRQRKYLKNTDVRTDPGTSRCASFLPRHPARYSDKIYVRRCSATQSAVNRCRDPDSTSLLLSGAIPSVPLQTNHNTSMFRLQIPIFPGREPPVPALSEPPTPFLSGRSYKPPSISERLPCS